MPFAAVLDASVLYPLNAAFAAVIDKEVDGDGSLSGSGSSFQERVGIAEWRGLGHCSIVNMDD